MAMDGTAGDERRAQLEMRASDTDRERVAEQLRSAAGQGRITLDELSDRLEAVYAAKTYAELVPITKDLPVEDAVPASAPTAGSMALTGPGSALVVGKQPVGARKSAIAIMSGSHRRGRWVVPKRFFSFTFWGGATIDLREARFEETVTVINASTIMGGIEIIVPEDVHVDVGGFGLMGGYCDHATNTVAPDRAPVVHVRGFAFWGGVNVRHKARKNKTNARQFLEGDSDE